MRVTRDIKIATLIVATCAASVVMIGPATADRAAFADGWLEVEYDGPNTPVSAQAVWSDGEDVWLAGSSEASIRTSDPWIQRCSALECEATAVTLGPDMVGTILAIDGTSATDIWATGFQQEDSPFGSYGTTLAAHFDGTTWAVVPTPAGDEFSSYDLRAIAAIADDDVWAVGELSNTGDGGGGGGSIGYAVHWDGAAWTNVSFPRLDDCTYSWLTGVLETGAGVLVSGTCWPDAGVAYGFVMRSTGSGGWETLLELSGGDWETSFDAITEAGDTVWVVGRRYATWPAEGSRSISFRLDDGGWSKIAVPKRSYALLGAHGTADGQVWASGWRKLHPEAERRSVVHWTGARWEVVRVHGKGRLVDVTVDVSGAQWVVGYDADDTHAPAIILRRLAPPT